MESLNFETNSYKNRNSFDYLNSENVHLNRKVIKNPFSNTNYKNLNNNQNDYSNDFNEENNLNKSIETSKYMLLNKEKINRKYLKKKHLRNNKIFISVVLGIIFFAVFIFVLICIFD